MALETACPPLSSPATTQPAGSREGVVGGRAPAPLKPNSYLGVPVRLEWHLKKIIILSSLHILTTEKYF